MPTKNPTAKSLAELPVQAPLGHDGEPPLVARLVADFGASWVDASGLAAWAAQGGDCVLLLAGDPVRFPEGQDVAVVLPQLQRRFPERFAVGVVPRNQEELIACNYGCNRWPTLLFLRDGQYVTAISGMLDWEVFVERVAQALAMPSSRAPTIGIAVVGVSVSDAGCP